MKFRVVMDDIWEFLNHKLYQLIVFAAIALMVFLAFRFLDNDSASIFCFALAFISSRFSKYFFKTLDKGHDHLIKIYKPERKLNSGNVGFFILIVFSLSALLLLVLYGSRKEQIFILSTVAIISFILIFFLGLYNISYSLSELNSNKSKSENWFLSLVLTETKFIVYSSLGRIFKFDRHTLQFNFPSMDELVLVNTATYNQEKLVINVSNLPMHEKQELRTLLGEQSENLNKD